MLTLLGIPPAVTLLCGFALALVLSFLFTGLIGRLSRRMGWLDQPSERRVHRVPVPRLGGVAIFLAFVLTGLLVYWPGSLHEALAYAGFLPAALFITAVMAYDDVKGLPPGIKLGLQTVTVVILILPGLLFGNAQEHGAIIAFVHNPLHFANAKNVLSLNIPLLLALPFTWFWTVGMMNTINFVDGLDGLAGGITMIAAVALMVVSVLLGQYLVAVLCGIFAGSVLGFLPHNWNPAKIFMGDSGAMFLGLALAVLANIGGAKLTTVLLLLGIPVLDVALVILQRMRGGRGAMHYDMRHLHHKLLASGFTQRQIVLIYYSLTGFFGLLAVLALILPDAFPIVSNISIVGASLAHLIELVLVGLVMAIILGIVIRRHKPKQPVFSNPTPTPEGGVRKG
ncbi:MAG TPA: MraY family glycosyltransferase [Ktedonobacterales bacterium]|nr:MraY family glycosyltransferase [Ktedonobacterales bacterium]